MSLATNLQDAFTRVATENKSLRTLINGNLADLATLNTTAKNTLVAAINEVKATADSAGGGGTLDELTDVVITAPAAGHILRHDGTDWDNVPGADHFQPVDSDLTAIAALTTTSYGRAFLALADQAALMGLIPSASATVQGKVELATDAETITGTDTVRATTPANVAAVFTDRIDTNTALGTSNTKVPSQNAVKAYADALIGAANGIVYKGVIDASTNPNYPAADAGHQYRISVAGKIGGAAGPNVEVGDLLLALTDGTAAGTHATVGANWNITQANLDGAVIGPANSVSGNLATFSGTSGKVIQDSGVSIDTDAALAANSNTRVPSQAAVRAYAQPLDSDLTAIAALTTTAYGRAFLSLADQAALMALIPASSETVQGKIEIATQAETNTGTDDARAVTPLKLQTRMAAYAQPLDSDLTAIAGLTSAANQLPYATGAGTWAMTTLSAFARTLLDDADAASARATLSVYSQAEIGDPNTNFVATFEAGLV